MSLNKYKGFLPGDKLPAENVNSIDPENIDPQAAGYLTGGTGHSALSVFQDLQLSGNSGKIKINVDGTEHDNIEIIPAFSLLGSSYLSKNFNLTRQSNQIWFNPTGTKIFYFDLFSGSGNGRVFERTLSTPWDISTAGAEVEKYLGKANPRGAGCFGNNGGYIFYVWANTSNDVYISRMTLSTPWDISTAGSEVNYGQGTFLPTRITGIQLSDDGLTLYVFRSGVVKQYTLSTAWDLSSKTDTGKTLATPSGSFQIFDSGKKLLSPNGNSIKIYSLSTAWDISTASDFGSLSVSGQISSSLACFCSANQTNVIVLENTTIYQYGTVPISSFSNLATLIQTAIRTLTGSTETVIYDTDHFVITSATVGRDSKILKLMSPSTGTDISGAGETPYLDCASNATETQGTGEEYRLVRLDENGELPNEIMKNTLDYEIITDSATLTNSSRTCNITLTAPTGKKVIGGGASSSLNDSVVFITSNYPASSTQWNVKAYLGGSGYTTTITAYAICVKI